MTVAAVLRRARSGDLPEIMSIERGSFRHPWSGETFADLLGRPGADVLVATLNDGIVGYAVLAARVGDTELANLAVDPGHRRRGIASALLRGCVDMVRDRGERWILLAARVSNEAAAGMYEKFGFREIGRHAGYYRDPPEDAAIFALEVAPARS